MAYAPYSARDMAWMVPQHNQTHGITPPVAPSRLQSPPVASKLPFPRGRSACPFHQPHSAANHRRPASDGV